MPPKKASKGASIIISNKAKIATAADNSTYIMYIIFNIKLLLNSRNNNKYVRRKESNPPYAGGTRLDADAPLTFVISSLSYRSLSRTSNFIGTVNIQAKSPISFIPKLCRINLMRLFKRTCKH